MPPLVRRDLLEIASGSGSVGLGDVLRVRGNEHACLSVPPPRLPRVVALSARHLSSAVRSSAIL